MKTVVLGKIIENVYEVDTKQKKINDKDGKVKIVYTGKPVMNKSTEIKEWKEICNFTGEPRYNTYRNRFVDCEINISENEAVKIDKEIFRADLNEFHMYSNKVIEEIDDNLLEAEETLEKHIRDFNKMMIESNEALKAYCDLHGLSYEDSDCTKLFAIIFQGKEYEIVDGVMKEKIQHRIDVLESAIAYSDETINRPYHTISSYIELENSNVDGQIASCINAASIATVTTTI